MEEDKGVLDIRDIQSKVYTVRGQQVMLDYDLAEIYGYEVKYLNRQVKRNMNRFPSDFMFQLSDDEVLNLSRCQNGTLITKDGRGSNIKYNPYAFTEQGIYMLATVLRGELAEQQSIFIMRTFREMRHYIMQNQQFVTQKEMYLVKSELALQMAHLSDKQKMTEEKVEEIQRSIDSINENFIIDKDYKEFVIYKGQKFEADIAYIDIYINKQNKVFMWWTTM